MSSAGLESIALAVAYLDEKSASPQPNNLPADARLQEFCFEKPEAAYQKPQLIARDQNIRIHQPKGPVAVSQTPETSHAPHQHGILSHARFVSSDHSRRRSSASSPASSEEDEEDRPRRFVSYPPGLQPYPYPSHDEPRSCFAPAWYQGPSLENHGHNFATYAWRRVAVGGFSGATPLQSASATPPPGAINQGENQSGQRQTSPPGAINPGEKQSGQRQRPQPGKTVGVGPEGDLVLEELETLLESLVSDAGVCLADLVDCDNAPPVYELNRMDVLLGRGGQTNHAPGNVRYRQLVKACQPAYILAKRRHKPRIATLIVTTVRKHGGRFLKKDTTQANVWLDVGNAKAREKTSQALREGAPELRDSAQSNQGSTSPEVETFEPATAERTIPVLGTAVDRWPWSPQPGPPKEQGIYVRERPPVAVFAQEGPERAQVAYMPADHVPTQHIPTPVPASAKTRVRQLPCQEPEHALPKVIAAKRQKIIHVVENHYSASPEQRNCIQQTTARDVGTMTSSPPRLEDAILVVSSSKDTPKQVAFRVLHGQALREQEPQQPASKKEGRGPRIKLLKRRHESLQGSGC